MPKRRISPAMRARANFVGDRMKGLGRMARPDELREFHAEFSRTHPEYAKGSRGGDGRRNPFDSEEIAEEIGTSTAGTLIGLGIVGGICAWIWSKCKPNQAQTR